ncbi:hypothetical protein A2J01_22960 [Rhodococcus sp. EPR-134]|jgi:hypothetical protein|nr:hypothetical protein A2J01_22960 [Rhodococcus sp. EPR-134]
MKRIIAVVVTLGVLWGVGTWFGDGQLMFSPSWFQATNQKVSGFVNKSEDTVRDKLPEPNFTVELPPPDGFAPSESEDVEPSAVPS